MEEKLQTRIIFVCVGNSCRSQMAEGFARHYAREFALNAEITSAGTRPEGYVHPTAIAVMHERAIDISRQLSKSIKPEELLSYDYVITMGCSDKEIFPATFRGERRDWGMEDPFGKPLDAYRKARDQIERKVVLLLREIRSTWS
ncbi:MAG: hypothetical protein A2Z21_10590 [Candidatus Fraserbacteria bacterium RBG_16_55_9]|uniref:Phosphotyrosine protein phosphatase I domain-containing protein n=1 Tax=Fraserbacteria sp. (strain RBG_16_55_9) TaxID=1817864 RepID=A0A1F5UQ71_FRAXR|nr:MAG: hypothetical protein A2Z21_10590 [Candidatus Fraserbacteria bacterium RBG_16_55_9]